MTCDQMNKTLPAYLDGELPPEDMEKMSRHLDACADCRMELAELKKAVNLLKDLPDIEPPPFFEQRIMSRIREDAESRKGFLQRLFYPLHVKIPIQALTTIFVAVLAFYVYQSGDPEIKRMAPLPAPITERQQPETGAPSENTTAAGKLPAPAEEILKRDSGLRQAPSFAPPPPMQIAPPAPKDEPLAPRAPAVQGAPSPLPAESAAPALEQRKDLTAADDQVFSKGQAVAPKSRLAKTSDAEALDAGKMEKDAESVAPMKKMKTAAPAPSLSTALSGSAQRESAPDLTLRIRDLPQAYREIEKSAHAYNGSIIERHQREGKDLLKIEIDAQRLPDFLNHLEGIGPVIRHRKSAAPSGGRSILLIELIQIP